MTIMVIADFIETELGLFIRDHFFACVPESDDALDDEILGKAQELGDILR